MSQFRVRTDLVNFMCSGPRDLRVCSSTKVGATHRRRQNDLHERFANAGMGLGRMLVLQAASRTNETCPQSRKPDLLGRRPQTSTFQEKLEIGLATVTTLRLEQELQLEGWQNARYSGAGVVNIQESRVKESRYSMQFGFHVWSSHAEE